MKKATIYTIFFILALVGTRIFVYSSIESNPREQVRIFYQRNLVLAQEAITEFTLISEHYRDGKASLEQLQKSYFKARAYFKRVEFLLEYFSHEAVRDHLNGPLTPNNVLTPVVQTKQEGLQVIDEMLFSTKPNDERQAVYQKIKSFEMNFANLQEVHKSISPTDLNIFEASRDQLIRLFTLCLSGYETPGSNNSFADAFHILQTMKQSMDFYLAANQNSDIAHKLNQTFDEALFILRNAQNLENFDRISFLRNYVNPLYKGLYQLQVKLGLEESNNTNTLLMEIHNEIAS